MRWRRRIAPHMRLVTCIVVAAACGQAAPRLYLMPMPRIVTVNSGSLRIDASFRVDSGCVPAAAERLTARIFRQAGLSAIRLPVAKPALVIECGGEGENEAYQLDVTPEGARLSVKSATGALRGMETFAQLVTRGAEGFEVPAVHIEDRPRYPWRGLMLDAARHWMPVAVVKRNLDAMAAVKLNVFHWHLADDQGFRVESKRWPRLHEMGSDGNFYTQSEIRDVVAYARERGIRVVPEFDVPGHATSWLVAYPELGSAPGPYRIERRWGIFEPVMDPTREETYQFLDAFFGEMVALFPDRYFHIGGDEVEETQWKKSTSIQAFAKEHGMKTSVELHAYFNRRVQELLKKHGKTMIGWDEVLAPGMSKDTVIQSWRGAQSLADAARSGYRGILSSGYYLDYLLPAAKHYAVDPGDGDGILGGEACMWSEYVSAETVDSRIWPRMAAIAERFWSAADVRDVSSMYARMDAVSRGLEWVGLRHRANYEPMLERLAGEQPVQPLRVLADVCESLGIDVRRDARKYTSLIDLNRFVDAVRPESERLRRIEPVDLRATFRVWAENDRQLTRLGLAELNGLSKDLSTLGAIGLQALDYAESGKHAPENWVAEQRRVLDRMEKPNAEVRLAAVRTVRTLLGDLGSGN
jgi:hexosaminidase